MIAYRGIRRPGGKNRPAYCRVCKRRIDLHDHRPCEGLVRQIVEAHGRDHLRCPADDEARAARLPELERKAALGLPLFDGVYLGGRPGGWPKVLLGRRLLGNDFGDTAGWDTLDDLAGLT